MRHKVHVYKRATNAKTMTNAPYWTKLSRYNNYGPLVSVPFQATNAVLGNGPFFFLDAMAKTDKQPERKLRKSSIYTQKGRKNSDPENSGNR